MDKKGLLESSLARVTLVLLFIVVAGFFIRSQITDISGKTKSLIAQTGDEDRDGILDGSDTCPCEKGFSRFDGCPTEARDKKDKGCLSPDA